MYDFYLTCPRGLEDVASDELKNLVNSPIVVDKGGVYFKGSLEDMYRVNYCSRVGMSVLLKLLEFNANSIDIIYKQIYNYPWYKLLSPNQTFALKSRVNSNIYTNQNYLTLKIKDAIVDQINHKVGKRPFVDKVNPDIYISIYVKNSKIKIFLNSSGKPLFMRGYRTKIHKASLNESLAAGLIQLSNWDRQNTFYDIMCGSGTLCIEAAMLAFNIPPAYLRKSFSFFNWNNFNQELWKQIKSSEDNKIKYFPINIYGSDLIQKNIILSKKSAEIAGLNSYIKFQESNFISIKPEQSGGTILINPPYGYRIGDLDKLKVLYKNIGDHFKNYFSGYDCYIFTGNLELLKSVGLRTKSKIILKNGKIDSRLVHYPIKTGKY